MNDKIGFLNDGIRSVFGFIDWAFFTLLGWVYKIFFEVSTSELFSKEMITEFFTRIQLIIGVFMIFKLSVSILQYIVNPDKMSDPKSPANLSNVFVRILTAMIMLTLIVPLNIRNTTSEFETQINNNGILFGTLYSLQSSLLKQNTLGKLVLGNGGTVAAASNGTDQGKNFAGIADDFSKTIAKVFIKKKGNCKNDGYDGFGVDGLFMDHLNDPCKGDDKKYAYTYYPLLGSVVAVAFIFVLVGYSIDIAIRAIKLAVIRLVAPIPIISYIDPNQEKSGAFGNWLKALVSTYLDLFIRLAIIYFVIFLVEDIRQYGIYTQSTGLVDGALVFIVIALGLFFFAKQAPQFIKDLFGIKGGMSNVGLAGMLGGTAMALGGGGLAGFAYGAMNGASQQAEAAAQGKQAPVFGAWSSNRDLMAKIKTGDKDAQGGLFGYMHDKMNYQTREKAAAGLHMSKEDLAQAKYDQDMADERAAQTAKNLEMASQDLRAADASGLQQSDPNKYATIREAYSKAYDANTEAQYKAQKAAKMVDKIEKGRAQMGAAPRMVDTKNASYRSTLKVDTGVRYYDSQGNAVNDTVITDKATIKAYEDKVTSGDYTRVERAVDNQGHFTDDLSKANYVPDVKNFDGTVDDSVFSGSYGTGANQSGHRP